MSLNFDEGETPEQAFWRKLSSVRILKYSKEWFCATEGYEFGISQNVTGSPDFWYKTYYIKIFNSIIMPPEKASKQQVVIGVIGIALIILVIIIGYVLVIRPHLVDNPTPGVGLTKINESGIPHGKIIHISDKDFEAFSQFAPIFRGTQQGLVVYANGTRIYYIVGLSFEEIPKFQGSIFEQRYINQTTYENEIFYEYNGTYYYFGPVAIP